MGIIDSSRPGEEGGGTESSGERWSRVLQKGWVCWLAISAAVLIVYLPSLNNAFQYDDLHSIVENPHIRSIANIDDFFWRPDMFTADPRSAMFRPLVLVSYALNHALGGYQVVGYHGFNIGLHLANCLLVCALARRYFADGAIGLASGLLFALHPISGEPVNYISSRSESLCALFSLLSLQLYCRARDRSETRAYIGSLLVFVCALFSKSVGIVVPLILLVRDASAEDMSFRRLVELYRYYIAFALLGLLYLAGVSRALQTALVDHPVRTLWIQASTQCKVLVYYLKLLSVPVAQSVEHQMMLARGPADGAVWAGLALISSLVYCLFLLWRRSRTLFFWIVWPGLFLLPTCVVPLNVLANEHRLYFPTVSVTVLLGWGLLTKLGRWGPVALVAMLLAYGGLAMQRSLVWRTPESLWADALEKAPLMPRPHMYMGDVYKTLGRNREAIDAYHRAMTVNPKLLSGGDLLAIYNNTGAVYLAMGKMEVAAEWYRRALSLDPGFAKARDALEGLNAIMAALQPETERYYKEALRQLVAGRPDLAIGQLRRGIGLQAHPKLYQSLALAYERQGDEQAAIAVYRKIVSMVGVAEPLLQGARTRLALLQSQATVDE